jgi:hypothetical protein
VADQLFVGSALEDYLRVLQVAGEAPLHPWSVRHFGPREAERVLPADSAVHPWARRYDFARPGGTRVRRLPVAGRAVVNSAFPYGYNDGPAWAGKGVTLVADAGIAVHAGPLSLTVAPEVFLAFNQGFPRVYNGLAGDQVFADWRNPRIIDLPERFGSGRYGRVDPGQSTLRVDVGPLAAGLSTANQHWGPATAHPLILGSNAPGYAHAFLGTSRPVDVGIGRLHGRLVWGRLEQSEYATTSPDSTRRFSAGVALVFTPRGVPGLEVGGARFFHTGWGGGPGWDEFTLPFQGLLKQSLAGEGGDGSSPNNQLASVFVRFVAPRAGLEVYGEYGKEDHNRDFRQLFLIPDNGRAYMLGFRRVWKGGGGRTLTALRGELVNAQRANINRVLPQAEWYTHSAQRQGHTNRGQALGSAAAYGGGGSVLAVDRYARWGRLSLAWERFVRGDRIPTGEFPPDQTIDAIHSLGLDGVFFFVPGVDVSAGVRAMQNYNRDFHGDVFNLNVSLGVRVVR